MLFKIFVPLHVGMTLKTNLLREKVDACGYSKHSTYKAIWGWQEHFYQSLSDKKARGQRGWGGAGVVAKGKYETKHTNQKLGLYDHSDKDVPL